jgi:SAM-dependent methyltransferase
MTEKFDAYDKTYRDEVEQSIAFAGVGLDVFTEAKAHALLRLIRDRIGDPGAVRALDVGCGTGETDRYLAHEIGELHGVDVSEGAVAQARSANPDVLYRTYDGERLPYGDGEFDLAFAICVVHHVAPDRWASFVQELVRVVRPGGIVSVIEHNPFNPLTRLAVARCAFDDDAVLLRAGTTRRLLADAGATGVDVRYILFHPFRNAALRAAESPLRRVPLGAQYVAAGVVR